MGNMGVGGNIGVSHGAALSEPLRVIYLEDMALRWRSAANH